MKLGSWLGWSFINIAMGLPRLVSSLPEVSFGLELVGPIVVFLQTIVIVSSRVEEWILETILERGRLGGKEMNHKGRNTNIQWTDLKSSGGKNVFFII